MTTGSDGCRSQQWKYIWYFPSWMGIKTCFYLSKCSHVSGDHLLWVDIMAQWWGFLKAFLQKCKHVSCSGCSNDTKVSMSPCWKPLSHPLCWDLDFNLDFYPLLEHFHLDTLLPFHEMPFQVCLRGSELRIFSSSFFPSSNWISLAIVTHEDQTCIASKSGD